MKIFLSAGIVCILLAMAYSFHYEPATDPQVLGAMLGLWLPAFLIARVFLMLKGSTSWFRRGLAFFLFMLASTWGAVTLCVLAGAQADNGHAAQTVRSGLYLFVSIGLCAELVYRLPDFRAYVIWAVNAAKGLVKRSRKR